MGVIVGAFLTRWIDAAYERHREVRKAVASSLILREELADVRAGFGAMADLKHISAMYLFCGIEEWESHRDLLLSAGMPHDDWMELARIFRRLLEVRESLRRVSADSGKDQIELNGELVTWMTEIADECQAGQLLLDPFVVEGKVPLLWPDRIFKGS